MSSVSAILLSFNCEAFIADALRGVFAQDYHEPMQIIISDDASTDGTWAVIQDEVRRYSGPHRLILNARNRNSGSKSAHLNDVFALCSGDVLISFDGDDVADPSRVRSIMRRFDVRPAARAVYSSYSLLRSDGRTNEVRRVQHPDEGADASTWFAGVDAYAPGATLAVRREVVDAFGPVDPQINEDVVLPFRASLLGSVEFIDEPLVRVRRHSGSLTADAGRFTSVESYRSRMRRGIDMARQVQSSRLRDLEHAARMMPDRNAEWQRLNHVVRDSLHKAEMTGSLVSPSIGTRLAALARLIRAGAYKDALLQHAVLALMPAVYVRYKRYRLAAAHGESLLSRSTARGQ